MTLFRGHRGGILDGRHMWAELGDENGPGACDRSGEFGKFGQSTLGVVGLDGLLQGRYVPERQQEEDDQVPLVLYRGYLQQQP